MHKILSDRKAILLFVGPALAIYCVIVIVPVIWSFVYSFQEGTILSGFRYVGLGNFQKLLRDPDFFYSLSFGLRYAVIVTAGQIALGYGLALLYVFYLKRSTAFIRTILFFPVVLPTVAVAQIFIKLFEIAPQYGLVNAIFHSLDLNAWIQPWLGQPNTASFVVIVMDIWKAVGFYAIILYSGILDIPDEIIEAARMDGAHGWSLVQRIITPLLRPVLVTAIIFSLNGTLKVFDSILALTAGGPGKATTPLTLYMYKTAFTANQYGYGSTIAVVLTLECLLVTLLFYRLARRNIS
jgi:ABC-type sugar transport system permease subunit